MAYHLYTVNTVLARRRWYSTISHIPIAPPIVDKICSNLVILHALRNQNVTWFTLVPIVTRLSSAQEDQKACYRSPVEYLC